MITSPSNVNPKLENREEALQKWFWAPVVLLACLLLTGCSGIWHAVSGNNTNQEVSSSLLNYLNRNEDMRDPVVKDDLPLNLPLRVGLAFVPAVSYGAQNFSEAYKNELLEEVKASIKDHTCIQNVIVIPDTYIRSGSEFEGIDKLAGQYRLDVMALISYDQVTHIDDTKASILYWTMAGAYFVKGSKNSVDTFVDLAVFDTRTHRLIFRVPGVNKMEVTTTLINGAEDMRKARRISFKRAMKDMTGHLNETIVKVCPKLLSN